MYHKSGSGRKWFARSVCSRRGPEVTYECDQHPHDNHPPSMGSVCTLVSRSPTDLLAEDQFRLVAVCARFPQNLSGEVPWQERQAGVYDCRWGHGCGVRRRGGVAAA